MKQFVYYLFFGLFFLACKNEAGPDSGVKQSENAVTDPVEIPRGINEEWVTFENAAGKKPAEIGLMKSSSLQSRIKAMLKEEYEDFKNDWKEESPIMIEDRIILATGCQTGDCKANKYLLFLDVTDNNINIINFKYGRVRSWEERAIIGLPTKLLEQYESIRAEQGL
jgi:hypothetical protein